MNWAIHPYPLRGDHQKCKLLPTVRSSAERLWQSQALMQGSGASATRININQEINSHSIKVHQNTTNYRMIQKLGTTWDNTFMNCKQRNEKQMLFETCRLLGASLGDDLVTGPHRHVLKRWACCRWSLHSLSWRNKFPLILPIQVQLDSYVKIIQNLPG